MMRPLIEDVCAGKGLKAPIICTPRGTLGGKAVNDAIVDEVRRVRDAHAAKFNYDLDAIFQDIKEEEKKSGLKFVSYPPRRTLPNSALQLTEAALSASIEGKPEASPVAETKRYVRPQPAVMFCC